MKKLVCLFLSLMLCGCMAAAETESPIGPAEGNYAEQHTDTQDFFIDILFRVDRPDDSIIEFPLQIKAFTVTYKYEVYRDIKTGYYAGFGYDPDNFVTLSPVQLSEDEPNLIRFLLDAIDLTLTPVRIPDEKSFFGHGDDYFTVAFTGGEFEITYHDRLDFSCYDGSLHKAEPKTQTHAYAFHTPE